MSSYFSPDICYAAGIFTLAAVFYITQPVPIYATSLLVILLSILFLSKEGPLVPERFERITVKPESDTTYLVPSKAIDKQGVIYLFKNGKINTVNVDVILDKDIARIRSHEFTVAQIEIVADADYYARRKHAPSYKSLFGTLADPVIILFLGGFMLARAAVKYSFDKNLTRVLLRPFGRSPAMILLGVMLITALLSAFMSNTATTAMMMTVILPLSAMLKSNDKFKIALALSVPVAANIGGMATPIGTPPNAIVVAGLSQNGIHLGFADWMLYASPVVISLIIMSWILLRLFYKTDTTSIQLDSSAAFQTSPKAIGFYFLFGLTVLLWVTENQHGVASSIIAFIPITFLAVFTILDKEDIRSLPWEILWLVAGGLALGIIINQTGLAEIVIALIEWSQFAFLTVLIIFGILSWLLSNFLSNTVTAALLVPLGISVSLSSQSDSISLIISSLVIGLATSIAMLLPISTPPNAIAIASGLFTTKDMSRFGLIFGILAVGGIVLSAIIYWPIIIQEVP